MTPKIVGKVDDLHLLLDLMPKRLTDYLSDLDNLENLEEIVIDLGYCPEVRFSHTVHRLKELGETTLEDIIGITDRTGLFNTDNRAGIERTLHRISAIRNRSQDIIGLTCRIGRAVEGTVDIIQDIVESGQNCLFLGPPGIGKTTILREVARVLSTISGKRVIVVDTSNEIAGDGDIPHPGIGYARRMQVPSPDQQHSIMIEAVENHMPEVVIVDEIGTEEETKAARTIAERGVQLVATAHGYQLDNLIKNPTLSDLIGGFQNVILGDEEAKFRGTSKTVIERKGLPTFDVVIELRARELFAIYNPVATYVDSLLQSDPLDPELRKRQDDGNVKIQASQTSQPSNQHPLSALTHDDSDLTIKKVFPFGININRLRSVLNSLHAPLDVVTEIREANFVLTTKSKTGPKSKVSQLAKTHQLPLHVISSQNNADITKFVRAMFKLRISDDILEDESIQEAQQACKRVLAESRFVELAPRPGYLRRIQHQVAYEFDLNSMSVGEDPNRRLRIYPRV
ncbi:single-stranded DNA-binding protein [Candidatus Marinamargulisbacteria bacterium SCGC AG-333-B06]|nr:single-stranded DNA-binding protein [Candidatus Marinamargulisbacteria bacterium SCGC AG-333-B06]